MPRIIARMPFAPREGDGPGALAIGLIAQERSGADHSFIVIELAGDARRADIEAALGGAGLAASVMASHEGPAGARHLVEVGEFLGPDDPRIERLTTALGAATRGATVIGGYPVPFSAADLAAPAEAE